MVCGVWTPGDTLSGSRFVCIWFWTGSPLVSTIVDLSLWTLVFAEIARLRRRPRDFNSYYASVRFSSFQTHGRAMATPQMANAQSQWAWRARQLATRNWTVDCHVIQSDRRRDGETQFVLVLRCFFGRDQGALNRPIGIAHPRESCVATRRDTMPRPPKPHPIKTSFEDAFIGHVVCCIDGCMPDNSPRPHTPGPRSSDNAEAHRKLFLKEAFHLTYFIGGPSLGSSASMAASMRRFWTG